VAVGVLVVAIFHGAGIDYRGTDVYAVIELLGGLAALGFAPGLFYIVALNAIIAEGPSLVAGVLQVLLFNAIWFAATTAVVAIFLLRPGVARRALARVDNWARRHARGITVLVFGLVGSYLIE
jgi:hypothetical protein